MSSRKKGRRTAGTPNGACGHPERELPAGPLRGFLAPALGSAVFPRAKFARGPTVPRTEDSTAEEHQKVWCARRSRVNLPTGVERWGKNTPEDHLWGERKTRKNKNKKEKRQAREEQPA